MATTMATTADGLIVVGYLGLVGYLNTTEPVSFTSTRIHSRGSLVQVKPPRYPSGDFNHAPGLNSQIRISPDGV